MTKEPEVSIKLICMMQFHLHRGRQLDVPPVYPAIEHYFGSCCNLSKLVVCYSFAKMVRKGHRSEMSVNNV